jgi:hypothetical protein
MQEDKLPLITWELISDDQNPPKLDQNPLFICKAQP